MQRQKSLFLYERIVDDILTRIECGQLKPGEKIPSVRKLSQELQVSLSSVVLAYQILETQGSIFSRPQSGYYVNFKTASSMPEPEMTQPRLFSQHVMIHNLVHNVLRDAMDSTLVPLGAAVPCPTLFPFKKLQQLHRQLMRDQGPACLAYNFAPGNPAFRDQLADRANMLGCSLSGADIVLTNGAIEAINLCLRAVTKPGDTVAVESPVFFGILETIENLGLKVLELPTHPGKGIHLRALETAIPRHQIRACLLIPNFSNPLGSRMPDENKEKLVQLLARHEIPLIENDIYGDLHFAAQRPVPAKVFDKKGLVMLCSSFTKSLAPGFRVGWVAPGRFTDQVRRLKYMTSVGTPTLSEMVVSAFIASGEYDKHNRQLRQAFASQVQQTIKACEQYFPKGTRLTRPQGGYVLWVEFPEVFDTTRLHQDALQQGISIASGLIFSASRKYQNGMRLNCGYPWTSQTDNAVKTLGTLLHQQV